MDNLFEPTDNFDFTKLHLGTPYNISKETFFTKFSYNGKPLFIQTPKCITKQGFIKNKKKTFCDLLFTNNDDIFINWIEKLEERCHNILYEKSMHSNWFETKIEKNDIENTFISPLKIYKTGKFYLLKANVKNLIKIYNEQNRIIELDSIIGGETNIISILEINGIEFTTRDFQIVFEVKQSMIVRSDPFSDECLIKTSKKNGEDLLPLSLNTQETDISIKTKKTDQTDTDDIKNILETLDDKQLEEFGKTLGINSVINTETIREKTETFNSDTNYINTKVQFSPDTLDNINNDDDILIIQEDTTIPEFDIQELDENSNEITKATNPVNTTNPKKDKDEIIFDTLDSIQLKKPNDVYLERYKNAKTKAKEAKQQAVIAILEAKNIKKNFLDDNFIDSDEELETFNFSI